MAGAAGHAVNGIVDEDDGDIFISGGGVDSFGHADGSQVAVTLVGEDDVVRVAALDAGGGSRGAAVSRLDHVAGEVIISHNGAANGSNTDGLALDAQLIDGLSNQAMDNTVGTAGAVMEYRIGQRLGFFKNNSHGYSPFCA